MKASWFRLKQPTTVWNGPGVKANFHKYTEYPGSGASPAQLIADHIGAGSAHLVINCHGHRGPELEIGTGLNVNRLEPFVAVAAMPELKMIWLSACNAMAWEMGYAFCQRLAMLSQTYVVGYLTELPDRRPPANHIEDADYAKRTVFDPYGQTVAPSAFYGDLAPWAGFKPV